MIASFMNDQHEKKSNEGSSWPTAEDHLIAYRPIANQLRKLAMDAMVKGDKKSNIAYNKIRKILSEAPAADAAPVIRCKNCACFMEYTEEYKSVEGADGDCRIRLMHSDDKQFCSRKYSDFCSDSKPRESAAGG